MADFPLSSYPYVKVRISCAFCGRKGAWPLARLAAKHGSEIDIYDLLPRLVADCVGAHPRHPGKLVCEARYCDLEPPRRPPDQPGQQLRLIAGGKERA